MHPEPDDPQVLARMRAAHHRARTLLGVRPTRAPREAWGWRGRTLGQAVTTANGPAWLRLAEAPVKKAVTTFWTGAIEAATAIPASVPRPRLRDVRDWHDGTWRYRAELYDHVPARPIATSPIARTAPDLSPTWWAGLRTALDTIATVPTERFTISQPYLDRAMPRFLGTPITTTAPAWTTAHGDLHYANLCGPDLHILDWEGWGLAPAGYDAAMLWIYSLLTPDLATRVRSELAGLLDFDVGRFAELVVITELLHTTTRGDNLELAEPLRSRAAEILGRPAPSTAPSASAPPG